MKSRVPKVVIDESPQGCVLSQKGWGTEEDVMVIISHPIDALCVISSLIKYLGVQYPEILNLVLKKES